MSGRQQTVEQFLSTPAGRENLARSIAPPELAAVPVPPEMPDLPEIPRSVHDELDAGLLIPLWAILLASGVGTLTWGILMLLGR